MPYYKFKEEDVFHNVMVTHPKNEFKIFSVSGSNAEFRIVHNALQPVSGAFTDNVSDHALALMFSLNRNIILNHNDILRGEWSKRLCENLIRDKS